MPIDVPEKDLLVLLIRIARQTGGKLAQPGLWDLNKEFAQHKDDAGGKKYNPVKREQVALLIGKLNAGPYPTRGPGKLRQFSFEYWYNYFFKEVPSDNKSGFVLAVLNDDGSFRTEGEVQDKPRLFNEMLQLGFRAYAVDDLLTANQVLAHTLKYDDNVLQQRNVNVLFRGDGRPWKTIRDHQGTKPQTRVNNLRVERNMLANWHPFNLQGNRVWVRMGFNTDNCLFSAVSVTSQFEVATKFPLLDDLKRTDPSAIGHAWVLVRDRTPDAQGQSTFEKTLNRFKQPHQEGALRPMTLAASKTNIYVVRMRDAYDTQKYQLSQFPEYASTDLAWADHFIWFGATRIHFSIDNANAGHLIVINESRWLQDERLIGAALAGPASLKELRAFKRSVESRGMLHNGAGGIVYVPANMPQPTFDIVTVRESFRPGKPPKAASAPATPDARGKVTIPVAFRA